MQLEFCYWLKIDCYIYKLFQVSLSNHKTKVYSRYAQDKEKRLKIGPFWVKIINLQRKTARRKEGTNTFLETGGKVVKKCGSGGVTGSGRGAWYMLKLLVRKWDVS